jgi:tRNA A37 methylthiotransferase MiaB
MHDLAEQMAITYAAGFVGKDVQVVLERKPFGQPFAKGYSEHYIQIHALYEDAIPHTGKLVTLRVTEVNGNGLSGYISSSV